MKNSFCTQIIRRFWIELMAFGGVFFASSALAANPIITDQFTADPTARVFEGQIYLYPSHDIPVPPGSGARSKR